MAGSQWWLAHKIGLPQIGAGTVVCPIQDGFSGFSAVNSAEIQCPAPGLVARIIVNTSGAPGVGNSWRFRFRVNGVASSQVDVTIAGAATSGTASGTGEAVALWDDVDTSITPAGTPPAGVTADIWLEWVPTAAGEFVYSMGQSPDGILIAAPRYGPILGGAMVGNASWANSDDALRRSVVPFPATITRFAGTLGAAPGAAGNWQWRVTVNAVEQAASNLSFTVGVVKRNVSGLAIAVAALDSLQIKLWSVAGSDLSFGPRFAICLVPTDGGSWCIGGGTDSGNQSNALVRYYDRFQENNSDWSAAEASQQVAIGMPTALVAGFAMEITTAPGAGTSHTVTQRVNGANSGQAVTFNDGATLKKLSTGAEVALVAGDLVNIQNTPAGAPANMGRANWTLWFGPLAALRLRTLTGWGL